jgi:hypothetical protein
MFIILPPFTIRIPLPGSSAVDDGPESLPVRFDGYEG